MSSYFGNVSESQSIGFQLSREDEVQKAKESYDQLVTISKKSICTLQQQNITPQQYAERVSKLEEARIEKVRQKALDKDRTCYVNLTTDKRFSIHEWITASDQIPKTCCFCSQNWFLIRTYEFQCISDTATAKKSPIVLSDKEIHEITVHHAIRKADQTSLKALGLDK